MQEDLGRRLVEIADELRGVAQNGLFWAERTRDEYDQARYEKVMEVAARVLTLADSRSAREIERIFRGELGMRSPLVGVSAAVFDEEGKYTAHPEEGQRQVVHAGWVGRRRRAAIRTWQCVRCGRRRVLRVKPVRLIGVLNSRKSGSLVPVRLYHLDFLCEKVSGELTLTNETIAYGYFREEE